MDDEKTRRTLKRYVTTMGAIRNYVKREHPNLESLHNSADVVYENLLVFQKQANA